MTFTAVISFNARLRFVSPRDNFYGQDDFRVRLQVVITMRDFYGPAISFKQVSSLAKDSLLPYIDYTVHVWKRRDFFLNRSKMTVWVNVLKKQMSAYAIGEVGAIYNFENHPSFPNIFVEIQRDGKATYKMGMMKGNVDNNYVHATTSFPEYITFILYRDNKDINTVSVYNNKSVNYVPYPEPAQGGSSRLPKSSRNARVLKIGPHGGKYYMHNGKKVYVKET